MMAIVTISRGTFSGGKAMAECLSQELGYSTLSREDLLAAAAEKYEATEEQLESALAHRPGFLEGRGLTKLHYIYCVQSALADAVRQDNVVYHGNAGHMLLRGIPHHLRLRVVADMEYRIKAAMARGNFTRERAIEYIKELDESRDRWVRWVYGVDRNDATTYDLVINLEHTSIPSACKLVSHLLEHDFRTTPEAQQIMEDFVLASEIKAKIGMDRQIVDDVIEIEARDGVVTISGTVRSLVDADRVRELVRSIPGVKSIESKMGTRW